ncbi:unnamed protein product [Larinioides sclopetarius]|uniref:Uncharacterized protein n=1 Tax=Larinioides sclopetarius TaxID=280406 RepID=A0AAV2B1L2_9ARAC
MIYTCNVCKKTTSFVGLKKYSAKEQEVLVSTPAPKIKLKKGDLNAGLFIKTPIENKTQDESKANIQEDTCQNEASFQSSSIPQLMDPSNPKEPQKIQKTHFTPEIKKNATPQSISSSKKKKRKGLLAQILNQEQEAKRQKKTLTSFLTFL